MNDDRTTSEDAPGKDAPEDAPGLPPEVRDSLAAAEADARSPLRDEAPVSGAHPLEDGSAIGGESATAADADETLLGAGPEDALDASGTEDPLGAARPEALAEADADAPVSDAPRADADAGAEDALGDFFAALDEQDGAEPPPDFEEAELPDSDLDEPQYPDMAKDAPSAAEPAPPAGETESEPPDDSVPDELIASLVAAAGSEQAGEDPFAVPPGADPFDAAEAPDPAAAGPAARRRQRDAPAPPPPLTDETPAPATPQNRHFWRRGQTAPPRPPNAFIQKHFLRLTLSLTAGLIAAMATFTALYIYQERVPPLSDPRAPGATQALELAVRQARELLDAHAPEAALAALEGPIALAPPSALRQDAVYLALEARHRALEASPNHAAAEALVAAADRAVAGAQSHPRAPEALYWQARAYRRLDMPHAARDAYRRILHLYGGAPILDQVLFESAELALELGQPADAVEHARRLLQQFPGSRHAGAARLVLADAYHEGNLRTEARAIYMRLAETERGTPLGAEAALRLAELALAEGNPREAVRLLDERLATAVTTAGSDAVYLALARAHRAAGDLDAARNTLNDLLGFFPESPAAARALVELSQVLDAKGQRQDALRVAHQAMERFPDDPQALANGGELLGLAGQPGAAARALIAADGAGANDPGLLLTAARHYRTAQEPRAAHDAYDLLRMRYPRSPQAAAGAIEQAETLYELGQITRAVERLEDLVLTLQGQPQELAALRALSAIYADLGIDARVRELAQAMAAVTTEPELLAESAKTLLRTGGVHEGQAVADRLDLEAVREPTAYQLLVERAAAVRGNDPLRALELSERAYFEYPGARTAEGDQQLLELYIQANRRAAARRVIAEIELRARANPVEAPRLLRAAAAWGDALHAAGDHRGAAEAYALAASAIEDETLVTGEQREAMLWVQYQRANMLLHVNDYAASRPLFEQVAESNAPWAAEAAMKADYARMQMRLRGIRG